MLDYNVDINYYSILELAHTATSSEIKNAYRTLARKHHPDKGGDQEKFKALSNAYDILMDEPTRASYDDARHHDLATQASDTYQNSEHPVAPLSKSTMVFNTTHRSPLHQSTSIVTSSNTHHIASAGIKAEDMSPTELYNLAMANEYVALALAKKVDQLSRLPKSEIPNLAVQYPSFAYQVLACSETRVFLYDIYSFELVKLLKHDYHLLLLITGSEVLTQKLLYRYGTPKLNGTDLHEIYTHHLQKRASCQAFELLLETNEPLDQLFKNYQALHAQDNHGHGQAHGRRNYTVVQLELLDNFELKTLALTHQEIAVTVIQNASLLDKFFWKLDIVDILLSCPNTSIDDLFNSPRAFYFDQFALVCGSQRSFSFLLHILNSPEESKILNGYDLETIIGHDCEKQDAIYAYPDLKIRHEHYKYLLELLTTPDTLGTRTKNTYQIIINKIGEFSDCDLSFMINKLSKTYDHNILAANTAFLMDSYQWNNASCTYDLSNISVKFFLALYEKPSLRSVYYTSFYPYRMCQKYYEATEILLQDPEAVAYITDEELYEVQQAWINVENNQLSKIFNQNPNLMQRWYRAYEIKKLHQGTVVSDYAEQPSLRSESEVLTKTRSLMHELHLSLAFNKISFSVTNHQFILWLIEQDIELLTLAPIPGIVWFLALSDKPHILNENLPLELINQQLETTSNKIKNNEDFIDTPWFIKYKKTVFHKTMYYLLPEPKQKDLWLNFMLENIAQLNDEAEQSKRYSILFHHTPLPLIDFIKDKRHIALLQNSSFLQQYFISHYQDERQSELFEIIDSYCEQNLFADALVIFSLMYQSELENNINNILPNYLEYQIQYPHASYYKSAFFLGLTSLLVEIACVISLGSLPIMLGLAITASICLIALGTYGLNYEEPVYDPIRISYQEALSRLQVSSFFQPNSEPTNIDIERQQNNLK